MWATYLPTYLPLPTRLWFAVGACFIFNHLAVLARSLRKQMGWPRANSYCLAQALMHACEPVSTQRSQLVRHSLNAISRRRRDSDIRHSINWTLVLPRASERFLSLFLSAAFSSFFLRLFEKGWHKFLILRSTSGFVYHLYTWISIYKANMILLGNFVKKGLMIFAIFRRNKYMCVCVYVYVCIHACARLCS